MLKYILSFLLFIGLTSTYSQATQKQKTLVFISGFGHSKIGIKKMFKDFKNRYPKLNDYNILYYTHNTRLKKIINDIEKVEHDCITLAGYSIGSNLALNVASELKSHKIKSFTFIDPWFTSSNWADESDEANNFFREKIKNLPRNSILLYGSDFVIKNNRGLSKVAGPFGTKQCKSCYKYLKEKWSKMGRVFKSGAGHRYFPELYIKQFLNKSVIK